MKRKGRHFLADVPGKERIYYHLLRLKVRTKYGNWKLLNCINVRIYKCESGIKE